MHRSRISELQGRSTHCITVGNKEKLVDLLQTTYTKLLLIKLYNHNEKIHQHDT